MTEFAMKFDLLDHGYCGLVESWGSDERVIESARQSTSGAFRGWGTPEKPGDEKLLRYLWEHGHHSPFEMAGLTVEVQAPILVFREWMRHRTQSYSELSARYTPMPNLNYVPSLDRCMMGSDGANKQAGTVKGADMLTDDVAEQWRSKIEAFYVYAEAIYQEALKVGVPKELARVVIPVGRYSRMRATANLRNWLGFLKLRMASDAQWEIREYANAVGKMIAATLPRTWELFAEGLES